MAVASVFFLMAIEEKGWAKKIKTIIAGQKNVWIMRNFVLYILLASYGDDEATNRHSSDTDELLEVCVNIVGNATRYKDEAERSRHLNQIRGQLKAQRETELIKSRAKLAIVRSSGKE